MHNFIPHAPFGSSTIRPSNQSLLRLAAFTFLIFVIAEVVGAIRSHSLSLLGDAIAMSVDVFTYFANMYAEATKHKADSKSFSSRLVNEFFIPSISVACLLGVTIYITIDAVQVLENPLKKDDVPISYLYGFSIANLLIDLVCATFFFIRGKEVFFEPIIPIPLISLEVSLDAEEEEREFGHLDEDLDFNFSGNSDSFHSSQRYRDGSGVGSMKKNLNMLSAFTHVGGDTVRTISVLSAAGISSAFGVNAAVCDAWAAVAVSITIVAISLPLIIDIILTVQSISNENSGGGGGGFYAPVPPFLGGKEHESTLGVGVFF